VKRPDMKDSYIADFFSEVPVSSLSYSGNGIAELLEQVFGSDDISTMNFGGKASNTLPSIRILSFEAALIHPLSCTETSSSSSDVSPEKAEERGPTRTSPKIFVERDAICICRED
jgi:hypothetical protein